MNALLLGVVVLISNFIPMGMPQTVPPSKCVMQGLFPIDDGTCQNYYMCIFDGAKFAPYSLKCAGTTLFDPSLKYCTSDYVCTQIIHGSSSTSESSSTSTSPSGSSSSSSSSASTSTLTSPSGSFSPSSSSASTSAPTSPSTSAPTSPSTSAPTSPSTSAPTSPSATSSTSSSTTTSKPTTALPCNGRYPLPDTKCQKYYFCFTNGVTTTKYNLTCPNSLLFNPDKQKCVLPTAYSCPPVV